MFAIGSLVHKKELVHVYRQIYVIRVWTLFCAVFQSDYSASLPLLIFGVCSLGAGLLTFFLPETIDVQLQDTLRVQIKLVSRSPLMLIIK